MRRIIITCTLLLLAATGIYAAARYVLIAQWHGTTGIQNTQAFGIRTASWAITYAVQTTDNTWPPMLVLDVYRQASDGKYVLVDTFATFAAGSGTTHVHRGAGRYYLTVYASACTWACAAYECYEQ
jgi:hypothetical protein